MFSNWCGHEPFQPVIDAGVGAVRDLMSRMWREKKRAIDLTDPTTRRELEAYVPLIQQGRGAGQLY